MIVMPKPLLDGFDLYRTYDCGLAEPEEVTHGARKGKDLLTLAIFDVDEDVAAE